jgi:AhpD family alkylhydroperoxidase
MDARIKVLAALLWSVAVRCEPCVMPYARKAIELGASKAELSEMLAIAAAKQAPADRRDDAACCSHA